MDSFFVNVGPSLSQKLPESQNSYAEYLEYSTHNALTVNEVTEKDTFNLLCDFKKSKLRTFLK